MPASHPAGRFHCLSSHIVIRILLVMPPGIVAEDGVDSQQTKQKDQPGAYFRASQIVHAMVSIAEVEHLFQAGHVQEIPCILLVAEYGLAQSEVVGVLLVVAGPDEVSGIALVQELGHGAAGKKWAVIQV